MSTKVKVIISSVAILTSFAVGRWAAPTKVVTVTQTVEVEKKTTDTDLNRDKHKETTTTTVTKPDGATETTTKTVEDTKTTKDTKTTDNTTKKETNTKEVTREVSKVTLSALVGSAFSSVGVPIYGGSISKPILGPIAVGAWYLTNSTGGFSLGLSF